MRELVVSALSASSPLLLLPIMITLHTLTSFLPQHVQDVKSIKKDQGFQNWSMEKHTKEKLDPKAKTQKGT